MATVGRLLLVLLLSGCAAKVEEDCKARCYFCMYMDLACGVKKEAEAKELPETLAARYCVDAPNQDECEALIAQTLISMETEL